jgi:uroporphyrinogen-III synthase
VLPLANRRVLITRPVNQASSLAADLEALGATPILIPTIQIDAPESYAPLDAALSRLAGFDWLIFTSANGAKAFAERALYRHVDPCQVERIAAIGPATSHAISLAGLPRAMIVPEKAVAESLAESLLSEARAGASMLLVRASKARDVLPETLLAAGADLTIAEAYRTVVPPASIPMLQQLFRTAPPDAITFTSASTAHNLAALLEAAGLSIPAETVLASIGPITSEAMLESGFPPTVQALESRVKSLIAALVDHYQRTV